MGLDNVSADVTIIDLTLRHQPNNDEPVAIHIRRVTRRPVNYAEVIEVDKVVHDWSPASSPVVSGRVQVPPGGRLHPG